MSELLKEGARIPDFTLRTAHDGKTVRYADLLHRRRIVLVLLPAPAAREAEGMEAWLKTARTAADDFAERDLTVLALAHTEAALTAALPERPAIPAHFRPLLDTEGDTLARLGGAPAFYLVGKDTGIKLAERRPPSLKELFRIIDSMPMRRDEMRKGE